MHFPAKLLLAAPLSFRSVAISPQHFVTVLLSAAP
jgi:hypothetical protein